MIFIVAENEPAALRWCLDNGVGRREAICLHSPRQTCGKRWQDGDRMVIVGYPKHVRYFTDVLWSCGMPSEDLIERSL